MDRDDAIVAAMDWPYDDKDGEQPEAPAMPTWHCPEDRCQCAELKDDPEDDHEFSVRLFTALGQAMDGALCRITHQARVLNEDMPRADGDGWVKATVPHAPIFVLLEWAPKDAPKGPCYPFRKWHYVEVKEEKKEGLRRRLHNLGYVDRSIRDQVSRFQRKHGYAKVTGELADIEEDLIDYHDNGRLPNAAEEGDSRHEHASPSLGKGELGDSQSEKHGFLPSTPLAKLRTDGDDKDGGGGEVPPPATKSKPQSGNALANPGGSAVKRDPLPTVPQAINKKEALYEWYRLAVLREVEKPKSMPDPPPPAPGDPPPKYYAIGYFWILGEALTWEVPNTPGYAWWTETVEHPLPANPHVWPGKTAPTINRKRLCRLPVSGKDAQAGADALVATQAELLTTEPDDAEPITTAKSTTALPSLLPTPQLYDELYEQCDVPVEPQHSGLLLPDKKKTVGFITINDQDLAANCYAYGLNQEFQTKWAARQAEFKKYGNTMRSPRSIGTPGKIWAVADKMDKVGWSCIEMHWIYSCINYGFHRKGQPPFQTEGGQHPWGHWDYSQIFVAVAGWCLTFGPGDTDYTWRETASVYTDPFWSVLVRTGRSTKPIKKWTPAPQTKYVGEERHGNPPTVTPLPTKDPGPEACPHKPKHLPR